MINERTYPDPVVVDLEADGFLLPKSMRAHLIALNKQYGHEYMESDDQQTWTEMGDSPGKRYVLRCGFRMPSLTINAALKAERPEPPAGGD